MLEPNVERRLVGIGTRNDRPAGCISRAMLAMLAVAMILAGCQRRADDTSSEPNTPESSQRRCREAFDALSHPSNSIVVVAPGSSAARVHRDQPFMQRCLALAPEVQRCLVGGYAANHATCSHYQREMASVTAK